MVINKGKKFYKQKYVLRKSSRVKALLKLIKD